MSADNFLAVHHIGSKWYVYDGCASVPDSEHKPPKNADVYFTEVDALQRAAYLIRNDYYEYGMRKIEEVKL